MLPHPDNSVQNALDSTGPRIDSNSNLQPAQPPSAAFQYVVRTENSDFWIGAIPMAMRVTFQRSKMRIRVIGCDPAVQFLPSLPFTHVAELALLIETDVENQDAVREFAGLIGMPEVEVRKFKVAPEFVDCPEAYSRWKHIDYPNARPLSGSPGKGQFTYEVHGNIHGRDLWWAIVYAGRQTASGIGIDASRHNLAATRTDVSLLVLRLDLDNEAAVRMVADLVCEGAYQVRKVAAGDPPDPQVPTDPIPAPSASPDPRALAPQAPDSAPGNANGNGNNQALATTKADQKDDAARSSSEPGRTKPSADQTIPHQERERAGKRSFASGKTSNPLKQATPRSKTRSKVARTAIASVPCLAHIPDFVQADWTKAGPRPEKRDQQGRRRSGRHSVLKGCRWLVHRLIITQQRSTVVVPDVMLAQVVWGAGRQQWPRNWRTKVGQFIGGQAKAQKPTKPCPPTCPLHGQNEAHQHFTLRFSTLNDTTEQASLFLGVLELFGYTAQDGKRTYDWAQLHEDDPTQAKARQAEIDKHRKKGRLVAVYLPVLVFGPSPRSGLSHRQCQLLTALTRETTRSGSRRPDKAKVYLGGSPEAAKDSKSQVVCPYLATGGSYIAFNGNAGRRNSHRQHSGRGYRLVGRTGAGCLKRAGYAVPNDSEGRWQSVAAFLTDLKALSGPFGLVVAGWHPQKNEWHTLDEMRSMARTKDGQRWLDHCLLRVFTRDDYLSRWRGYFARKLGFSFIPGGEENGAVAPVAALAGPMIKDANDLQCWMTKVGMTDQELADQLGKSREWVSQQRSGKKKWSPGFAASVNALIEKLASERKADLGGQCNQKLTLITPNVTKNSL